MIQTKVFNNKNEVAKAFADFIVQLTKHRTKVHIALSGGSTPKVLFDLLASNYRTQINWKVIHFWWGDERCVPPDSSDSNYNMTHQHLLQHIDISESQVHRVLGEADPQQEAQRYGDHMHRELSKIHEVPVFDLIILGMGSDGHTASIFPHQMDLLREENICAVATHPESGQQRITITGHVINQARHIAFLVTGNDKTEKVEIIINKKPGYHKYPAAHVAPITGKLTWYLDHEAAAGLET